MNFFIFYFFKFSSFFLSYVFKFFFQFFFNSVVRMRRVAKKSENWVNGGAAAATATVRSGCWLGRPGGRLPAERKVVATTFACCRLPDFSHRLGLLAVQLVAVSAAVVSCRLLRQPSWVTVMCWLNDASLIQVNSAHFIQIWFKRNRKSGADAQVADVVMFLTPRHQRPVLRAVLLLAVVAIGPSVGEWICITCRLTGRLRSIQRRPLGRFVPMFFHRTSLSRAKRSADVNFQTRRWFVLIFWGKNTSTRVWCRSMGQASDCTPPQVKGNPAGPFRSASCSSRPSPCVRRPEEFFWPSSKGICFVENSVFPPTGLFSFGSHFGWTVASIKKALLACFKSNLTQMHIIR